MKSAAGILLVDKPAGVTSFAVVNHVRRTLIDAFPSLAPVRHRTRQGGAKPPRFKCGHAGTLDPLATGLLILLIGKGSRLAPFLLGLDKTYAATVRFGSGTDTLDREGETISTAPVPDAVAAVTACLDNFRGDIRQVPPLISALKKDGQPLYKRVRAGQDVPEPAARPVTIHRLEITGARWGAPDPDIHEVDLLVECSSGTYLRSLARDLASATGSEGHLQELRRLAVGPFTVEQGLDQVLEEPGDRLLEALIPLGEALPHLPVLALNRDEAAAVRVGQQPRPDWLPRLSSAPVPAGQVGSLFRMLDQDQDLVAVGKLDDVTGDPRIAAVIPVDSPATRTGGVSACD
jgi:tRNA pseudouridine55 synthase